MPATSSKRTTPARKKEKLAHDSTSADKEASNGPVSEAQTQVQYVEASASASSPSRNRPRRLTQKVTVDYAIEPSPEESPEPSTSTPTPPRSAAAALATPPASTPQVTFATPPPKNSVKGKSKARAKSEDQDYNDDAADETSSRRDPDLEIFTPEGPIDDVNRVQLKTSKAKAMRPFWLQGAVQPTFFGVPTSDVLQNVADQERDAKSEAARGKHSLEEALFWPQDGLAETCLDSKAYALIKKSLQKFWLGLGEDYKIATDVGREPLQPPERADRISMRTDDAGEGSDEEFANEDENAIAALDANQEPINLDDPKFANIPNLGIEEKGPQTGDMLHISVGPPGQERPVQIPRGISDNDLRLQACRFGASLQTRLQLLTAGKGAKGEAKLEMVVCHEILSIFSIPNPDSTRAAQTKSKAKASADTPLYIRLDPILSLEHLYQSATSLSWARGELFAFGGSQGWIGVWNVDRILRNPSRSIPPPPPDYVIRAHRSAITDLTFILAPPISSSGHILHTCLPQTLFSVSLDGWTAYISLPRCSATSIERSRAVHYACTFSPFTGGSLVHEMADGSIAHYSLRPEEMLPAGTAHGEVKLANIFHTLRRSQRNHVPIYQQVLDRTTGELTVRHHLLAEVANNAEPKKWAIAQWHPSLAVTG
ncbi:hypothetical protein NDA18_005736 [Ustilago nuda]|nr:hypothetical protein NDA18_005736 [Ustilago nuda]